MKASAIAGRLHLITHDVDALVETIDTARPCAVVLDREDGDAEDVLRQLASLPRRDQTLVILVVRDTLKEAPPGANLIVLQPALRTALLLADQASPHDERRVAFDRLLTVSVLSGPLDQALESAADQVAAGFGVDRCVISVRGDSTGGAAVAAHTWDSVAWSQTAERCRAAATAATTLVAPATHSDASCESYMAVPLATPLGSHGFIGLVVAQPRIFSAASRLALQAVASRLAAEVGWRGVQERTTEELDRLVNGPGLDPLLGIWNRTAMSQLLGMHVSASLRTDQPLSIVVLDIVGLHGVNTRYGLEVGDRLLRRVADALRTTVRTEDLVGRWSGDKIAVALQGTSIEGARRVAERVHAALGARPLELAAGGAVAIATSVGIAALQPKEGAAGLVARAVGAAKKAQADNLPIAGASIGPMPRLSQQQDIAEELRATLGGTYRLLHEISRGGMGVVYRAEDLALERAVAIKMLRPDLAEDRAFVEHLRSEAAMLARIQHPNLVQIYTFGQTGGDSYFVMELVEGEGLQQSVDRHRLEGTTIAMVEALAAIEQIASALDALHDRGIIHRDVKPANVIRDPFRGRSVLLDVGIARRYGQYVEASGTPGYVAPEVITGQEATARSDVYGLAATAYTILTLTEPWGEGDQILARQCSDEELPAPSSICPELAPADELLRLALSKDPSLRPISAGAFARALSAALVSQPPPSKDVARWAGNIVMPSRSAKAAARTRGVVFRSVTRAVGVREAERLRDAIGGEHPDLAQALTDTAPLGWLPTELFTRLLAVAPQHVGRDGALLARDVARASVRASFRKFFPSSAATLVPERTLSAVRNVWNRYQSWGTVLSMPVNPTETVVRIGDTLREPELCAWAAGMLEQLVTLSGGRNPRVDHEACEARGDDGCLYRVMWERAE